MRKDLLKIIGEYETSVVENALVQLFIEQNNIAVNNNVLVKKILQDVSKPVVNLKKQLQGVFQSRETTDFVNVFELLIPYEDKNINGAFFTPD